MAAKKKAKTAAKPKPARKPAVKLSKAKAVKPQAKPKKKPAPAKAGGKRAVATAGNSLRALAQRILEVSASNDEKAILNLYAPDVISIEMGMPPMVGIDALKQKFAGWSSMVSSATFVAESVWVDGNAIIVEWSGDCVLAGSGKQVQLREIAIHEIENGKIKRERYYYDPSVLQP